MAKSTILNSVEEVIEDFRNGRIVIVVDDEDRENEGDFIVAAEKITPEIVNFMLKEGRGVLCAPLSEERCAELGLNMMEENNTSLLGTPFTVTVDLLGNGCTTGVSIHDRAATIRALADPATRATDLGRPGHINPLRARQKGVLRRPGHTEAAIDLARLAGLQPAGALIEIMNEDGSAKNPSSRRARPSTCRPHGATSASRRSGRRATGWSTWRSPKASGRKTNRC